MKEEKKLPPTPVEPKNAMLPKQAGGVYMPPHKMK